jgi:hypothetical protein
MGELIMGNIIIGIHGLSNKPSPDVLFEGWEKAMLEGLRKNRGIERGSLNFDSVYWADVMYDKYDPNPDLYKETEEGSLKRYKDGWLDYLRAKTLDIGGNVIDSMKELFGMDNVAELVLKIKLTDLYNYYTDKSKRDKLRNLLASAVNRHKDKRIMLVAHSMGSVIAYDVLREIGWEDPMISINHFVTIGSPLGLPHVKYKIMEENSLIRTPIIVKKWTNLADRQDPVAMDIHLQDDFEANDAGVKVNDDLVMNDWGGIHHKSYGYLRTPEFTDILRSFI